MNWHVVVQVGTDDSHVPDLGPKTPRLALTFDGGNEAEGYRIRENILELLSKVAVRKPAKASFDLAVLASAVYSADHCIQRSASPDGWTRNITLHMPVANPKRWKKISDLIVRLLSFLSGDTWQIKFRKRRYEPEILPGKQQDVKADVVSLFSGGVDSLVGAIDLLEQKPKKAVALIGHYGAGMTRRFQTDVFSDLKKHYRNRVSSTWFFVEPPTIEECDRETTKRTRSFLFFSLGILVANSIGKRVSLCVSENGLITLNVPFTDSRAGSLSTRTTHPFVVALLQEVLTEVGIDNRISLPFQHRTKGEMLASSRNRKLLNQVLPKTMSCAHPEAARWHGMTPGTHCGYCVPCIIRRAAVQAAKSPDAVYAVDVLKNPPGRKTESGRDHWAIRIGLQRFKGNDRDHDICDVMTSGPIEPREIGEWVDVYRRGMRELSEFFKSRRRTTKKTKSEKKKKKKVRQ